MINNRDVFVAAAVAGVMTAGFVHTSRAQTETDSARAERHKQAEPSLAKAAQNPVANMVSLPLQYNYYNGGGLGTTSEMVLNVQPVLPLPIGKDWLIVSRTIVPFTSVPIPDSALNTFGFSAPGGLRKTGVADIQEQAYVTSAKPGTFTWAVGPIFSFPTALNNVVRTGQWGLGPTAVGLVMPGPWVIGALVNNIWRVGGTASNGHVLNSFTFQPFINYNLKYAWAISTAPLITSNWSAPEGQRWTVPLGLGVSKVAHIADQPMNFILQYYHNVKHPGLGGSDQVRLEAAALWPTAAAKARAKKVEEMKAEEEKAGEKNADRQPPEQQHGKRAERSTTGVAGGEVAMRATPADVPGPSGGPVTQAYVRSVAQQAYVWGWPLVYVYNQRNKLTQVPEPMLLHDAVPVAPTNQLAMLTYYANPSETLIADPNQDVVYGLGFLALAKEPVVLQAPDFGKRFWTLPIYDARTDQISQLGLQYGTKPGFYLIVGPTWKGTAPSGIIGVIRSSTDYAAIMPRIFLNDTPEDSTAIQPLLNQILMYPLSEFDGTMKTRDWSKLPSSNPPVTHEKYSSTQPPWVDPATFFDELPTVMKQVPPMPGEEALYRSVSSVLEAAATDSNIAKTLRETAFSADADLIAPMMRWRYDGLPAGNGWTSPTNNGAFGTDYVHRAGAVKADPYDNKRNETMYYYTDNDSRLEQLVGTSSYEVTFAKGELPPVKAFWSLTMYDPEHLFYPNPLHRFALGTKNKSLKYNADSSLTLYLGNKSPGPEKESNWLPAPPGEFSIWIRAYWPEQAMLDGTWKPPVVRKVQ